RLIPSARGTCPFPRIPLRWPASRTGAPRRSSLEPLRHEARADVDVDLAQRPGARVAECVSDAGRDDEDLPRRDLELLGVDGEGRAAVLDDEDLFVRVPVRRDSCTR